MTEEVQNTEAEQAKNLPPQVETDDEAARGNRSREAQAEAQTPAQTPAQGEAHDEHSLRNAVVSYRVVEDDSENVLSEHESRAEATREAERYRRQGTRARVRIAALSRSGPRA